MGGRPEFCINCGAPLKKRAKFCGACGRQANQATGPEIDTGGLCTPPAGPERAEAAPAIEKTGKGNIFEIWRRVLLAALLCAAVALAYYAPMSSLFSVSPVDFAAEQKKMSRGYMGLGILSDDKKRLAGLPLEKYVEEVTRNKVIPVAGGQWETFHENLAGSLSGAPPGREWAGRVGYYRDRVYFRSVEGPLNQFSGTMKAGEEMYLRLGEAGRERYIRLRAENLDDGDFGPGRSIFGAPPSVVYPLRVYSPIPALAGLALYIFLPWPQKKREMIAYSRWRLVMGDFGSMLLLVMFFSLPILIVGGTVQAATDYLPFTLIFWVLAALGAWALKMVAWMAGLQVQILPDRLRRITIRDREDVLFDTIDYIQPIVQVPPRWLIRLSWLAAFAGRSVSAAGSALILSGTEYGGIRIVGRDGRAVNIWFTDQAGKIALPGYDRILEALKNAGVPVKKEVMRVEGISSR